MTRWLSAQAPSFSAGLAVLSDGSSLPSSVTIIREADGSYYASFVVAVQATPLPVVTSGSGVDLGLTELAVTSDGELVANPRHLRARQLRLAKAQRALCRKKKGSANRAKDRVTVAVQHPSSQLIERRRIAAGLAEIANACGADVRPGPTPAVGDEAGTHRGAA